MLFITAGLGGGTGTGAAPVIAQISRELDILTVGIVTIPFSFEGRKRRQSAEDGIRQLKQNVDALLIISNDKLRLLCGDLPLSEAFTRADNVLTTAAKGIAEIITVAGYINVDFADVISVMTRGGIAFMGSASAHGYDRARKVIDETINSPLLYSNDIRGASRVLLNVTSGQDEITMDEVGIISDTIMARVGVSVNVIWGTCTDETLTDEIRITLVATGFRDDMIPEWLSLTPPKKEVIHLEKFRNAAAPVPAFEKTEQTEKRQKTIETPQESPTAKTSPAYSPPAFNPPAYTPPAEPEIRATERELIKDSVKFEHTIPSVPIEDPVKTARLKELNYHNLSNPDIIDEVERIPAYKRKKVPIQEEMFFEEEKQSRYTLGADAKLRSNNSFLFDVVD